MQPDTTKSGLGTVIAIVIVLIIIFLAGWYFLGDKDESMMMKEDAMMVSPNQSKSLETLETEINAELNDFNSLEAEINSL